MRAKVTVKAVDLGSGPVLAMYRQSGDGTAEVGKGWYKECRKRDQILQSRPDVSQLVSDLLMEI